MALFDGKVVVITGAGAGLGRAYALAFAREGAKVVVNDLGSARDGSGGGSEAADRVVQEIRDAGGEAVASYDSVATMAGGEAIVATAVEAFGGIDVLVNNAGILRDRTLLKMSEEEWDAVIAVHLKGTFAVTKPALARMVAQGRGGRIVNTSSYAGLKGNFGQANYGAAKAGIAGFTRVVALEAARHGVTVNCIAPMAKTRLTDDIDAIPAEMRPEQVAPMVLFLASDLAADVTGRIFGVHGGHLFEYRMELTPGVKRAEPWTPEAIAAALPEIGALPSAKAGEGGAAAAEDAGAQVRRVLEATAECLDPARAGDWRALIHFDVEGAGRYALEVAGGKCRVTDDMTGKPTCVVKTSAETFLAMARGQLDGSQAFMQGKVTATNLSDMMKYGTAFDQKKLRARLQAVEGLSGGEEATPAAEAQASRSAAAAATPPAAAPKAGGLNRDLVGKVYEGRPALVDPDATEAYARATGDDNPAYLDHERPGGAVAPPMFAVRLNHEVLGRAVTDPDLNVDLLRVLHGEQDMTFHELLRPGDLVRTRARIAGIEDKPTGQVLTLAVENLRDGKPACETVTTIFVRAPGAKKGSGKRAETPAAPAGEPLFERTVTVAQDQPRRYAAASLDENPIHLDEAVARAAGLPGVILHGLCTMAFAQAAVVDERCGRDPARLRRLKVRFSRPVFPGDTLTIRGRPLEAIDGGERIAVEIENQRGEPVITGGIAEVRA